MSELSVYDKENFYISASIKCLESALKSGGVCQQMQPKPEGTGVSLG